MANRKAKMPETLDVSRISGIFKMVETDGLEPSTSRV